MKPPVPEDRRVTKMALEAILEHTAGSPEVYLVIVQNVARHAWKVGFRDGMKRAAHLERQGLPGSIMVALEALGRPVERHELAKKLKCSLTDLDAALDLLVVRGELLPTNDQTIHKTNAHQSDKLGGVWVV
jgi:hypothetical protein